MIELPDYSRLASKLATGDWEQVQRIIEAVREIQEDGGGSAPPDVELGVVRPEDFDLGSDEENIEAAIAQAIADGEPLRLDGSYNLSAPIPTITFTGNSKLSVIGHGHISVDADFSTPVFTFFAPHSTPVGVSQVLATTRIFPGGTTGTACTRITAVGHGGAIGDIYKIVADDQIAGSTAFNRRMGEFAYGADVSGNDIYVAGPMLNAYATNIRLCRLNTAAQLIWDGPTFSATSAQAGWDTFFIRVRGFLAPRVRTRIHDGYDVGIEFSSCVQAEADLTFRNLRNRVDSEGVSGYGVQDSCSWQTRATIRGVDCRHAYTTITNTSGPSDEPYLYGQTVGGFVTGSIIGGSAASFDVHTEGTDTTFSNVVTAGVRFGQSSSGGGYGMRGQRTRVINAVDRGSANGAQFYAEAVGDCTDCELINLSYIGTGQPIRINQLSGTQTATRPKVRGGYVRTSHATIAGVAAFECDGGVIEDLLIAPTSNANGCSAISLGGNAEVVVRRLTIDLSGYTGTQFRAFSFGSGSTGNSLIVEGANVINAAGKFQSWFHGQSTSGSSAILSGLSSDAAPTTFYQGHGSLDVFQLADGWSLLGSWTYSTDVTNVDFTNLFRDEIRVIARGVTKSASGTLNLRASVTNGSSFLTTSGDYVAIAADGQETALSFVPLHDTGATAARSGMATLSGLMSNDKKAMIAHNRGVTTTIETTSVINAIRLLPSSGSLTGGTITVLGR